MSRVEELAGVPEGDLEQVVSDFSSEGASVEVVEEGNGSWRVIATFED